MPRFFWAIVILAFPLFCSGDYDFIDVVLNRGVQHEKIIKYEGLLKEIKALISQELTDFQRPYTLVKIGTDNLNIIDDLGCHQATKILFSEKQGFLKNEFDVILPSPISLEDWEKLTDSEFFDVIILSNFHGGLIDDWQKKLQKIVSLGYLTFVVIPPRFRDLKDRKKLIEKMLVDTKDLSYEILESEKMKIFQSQLLVVRKEKKRLLKNHVLGKNNPLITYQITVDKKQAIFQKFYHEKNILVETPYLPGINLLTFLYFNGIKPSSEFLKEGILKIRYQPHSDFMPHNMIIDKQGLKLIDFIDWRSKDPVQIHGVSYMDKNTANILLKMIDSRDRDYLRKKVLGGF
jgi:hypothetical protein